MDRRGSRGLARWLAEVGEDELVRVLREYGEEPRARRVARAILRSARRGELTDTVSLANVVARAVGRPRGRVHPATRTFQALRIAVNEELAILERFLADSWRWLRPGGRLVTISYHSLEDRIVKRAFTEWARSCLCPRGAPACRCGWSRKAIPLTRRPVRPTRAEVERNPRSRSARLRAVERLAA
jgi:16S rRNA (cytosine1402-N4)-methyltransferase